MKNKLGTAGGVPSATRNGKRNGNKTSRGSSHHVNSGGGGGLGIYNNGTVKWTAAAVGNSSAIAKGPQQKASVLTGSIKDKAGVSGIGFGSKRPDPHSQGRKTSPSQSRTESIKLSNNQRHSKHHNVLDQKSTPFELKIRNFSPMCARAAGEPAPYQKRATSTFRSKGGSLQPVSQQTVTVALGASNNGIAATGATAGSLIGTSESTKTLGQT